MIQTKGYKAFRGVLKIYLGEMMVTIRGDWVYDPNDEMWHNECGSFPNSICEVAEDESVLIITKRRRRNV